VSYRERSYRKLNKVSERARETGPSGLSRSQFNRVMHWSDMDAMPKLWDWGLSRKRR
jgi:hypothetical protein